MDDFKVKAVIDIIQQSPNESTAEELYLWAHYPAAGSRAPEVTIQSGIPIEKCKEIVKTLKDSKIRVQPPSRAISFE